jgi:predicted nucleic acid-binding Zn ribbon protein
MQLSGLTCKKCSKQAEVKLELRDSELMLCSECLEYELERSLLLTRGGLVEK